MIEPIEKHETGPCDVCKRDPESDPQCGGCICPECRICGEVGNPKCWREHFPEAPAVPQEAGAIITPAMMQGLREIDAHAAAAAASDPRLNVILDEVEEWEADESRGPGESFDFLMRILDLMRPQVPEPGHQGKGEA